MPEIQLNGKTIATQTGTNEPVLKNNVVMESGFSIPSGVIDSALSGATFPAGNILQVVQTQDHKAFSYTNTSSWYWGTSSTRADDSHGGVASYLNCTLTTKGTNSNFLVCANLQNAGASAAGYTWGMNTYWSVDSYANPLIVGVPSTHGLYSNGQGLQSGFWQDSVSDSTWYPHYTQVLKSSNTIAKGISIIFKIVISSYYTSGGNTLYYNRQNTTNNGSYRLVPVSTHTIYEIAS